MQFTLTSSAFPEGGRIPSRHTGDGEDLSPPLQWMDPPKGTRSLALVCQDQDAPQGPFTHWLIFNLPGESRELSEGILPDAVFSNGTVQGTNDSGQLGYRGPRLPPGQPHRFVFTLHALDQLLELPSGCSLAQLQEELGRHTLAEARLTGAYGPDLGKEIPEDPLEKKAAQDRASLTTAPLG